MEKTLTFLLLVISVVTTYAQQPGAWQSKGSGITAPNRSIQGVAAVDSNIAWAITYDVTGATFSNEFTRTIDGGATWTSGLVAPAGQEFFMLEIFALNRDTAWISGETLTDGVVYKTTDGGQTWIQQAGPFEGNSVASLHFFNAQEGFAYGGIPSKLRIWTTDNGGATWEQIPESSLPLLSAPISANDGIGVHYGNEHHEVIGDTIWFGNRSQRIWRSTDKGKTWKAFNLGARAINNIFTVAFKDSKNGMAGTDRQGVFATHDGGETWYPLPSAPASLTYYQIEHIPGSNGVYYATYEGSQQFYNDVRHIYSIDNGKTWIPISDPGIECLEFISLNKAWGGGIGSNGGADIAQWTGNMPVLTTPDYGAVGIAEKLSFYTMTTPKHQQPLKWKHIIFNTGKLALTDVKLDLKITKDGNTVQFQKTINSLASAATATFEFDYTPTEIGKYTFSATASNAQLGADFYKSPTENYEVNDSIIAKDDGVGETQLGFPFGNPNWYGYYGSEFELNAPDTLTDISVYISRFSTFPGTSINLTVNAFDTTGSPNVELFHSERLLLTDYGINATNPKLTYQLEQPLLLPTGKYVIAAGQDTLQGRVGFNFDINNVSKDGFWLVSPIAGGGYPWAHAVRREAMMIRPHFKTKRATTATQHLTAITTQINLYPNPFTNRTFLEFELKDNTLPVEITVTDVLGRTLQTLSFKTPNAGINRIPLAIDAPPGLLLLTLRQGTGIQTMRLVKQ